MTMLNVLLALFFVFQSGESFNFDQKNLIVEFTIPGNDSLFGYSVALRKTSDNQLVVGAPLYNNKEGAVYSCNIASKSCSMFKDYSDSSNSNAEQRSQEFMGVSLTSSGEEVMAAAPRWWINRYGSNYYRGRVVLFNSDNSINYDRVPCVNERYGNLAFGYCEAGMSASSTKFAGLPLFVVGAPGSLNYQGVLFTIYKTNGAVKFARTPEDRLTINSYMGYSVTTGKFSDTKEANYMIDIAGGAPRGSEMQGKVIVYKVLTSYRISTLLSIESPHDQVGSYFGATVAAVDLNNDGKDDLLVGSPLYSKIQDEGRVYIYMNRPGTSFNGFDQTLFLEGDSKQGARFGSSIANIGDINNDGFQDVAIGAPYDGTDGNGVVYIYNGGQSGLKSNSPQKILASDMPTLGQGFGISLSGGVDVDNNGYPDLAIGAFKGSNAFIIKSKPVIKLSSKLDSNVKAVPSRVNDKFKCAKAELQASYNCLTLTIDLSYTGLSTPSSITLETTIELDKSKIRKRAITTDGTKSPVMKNIVLTKDQSKKLTLPIAVLISRDGDVISPIEFTASYRLIDQSDCQGKPCALLDEYSGYSDSHQITYLIECASETTCKPNLEVSVTELDLPKNRDLKPKEVLYGVVNQIHMLIDVKNTGEAAYQSIMKLNFSSEIQFNEVQINSQLVGAKKTELNQDTHQLQFPVGNPIISNGSVSVLVKFTVAASRPKQSKYTFSAEASAFGEDVDMNNNRDEKSIDVKIETCVGAVSSARPSQIQYRLNAPAPPPPSSNDTLRNESVTVDVIGSEVVYTFHVQNKGKLPVDKLTAAINVVMQKSDLDFIYVVYLSVDGIACKADFNPLNYTSDYEKIAINNGNVGKQRKRREAQQDDVDRSRIITCFRQGDCKLYSCNIDRIEPNKGSIITMVTRLWDHNLPAINPYGVETTLKVEFSGRNKELYKQREECKMSSDVSILLRRGVEEKEAEPIPWWVFLVAVLGALLLLAGVVAILYKAGFFKRNRKIKEITGPTDGGNEAHNPKAEDDDEDDE